MRNSEEILRKLRDAEDCLKLAEKTFKDRMFRGSLQNSQGCVELCAKAVISVFEEPDWTHNPSGQLRRILEANKEKIEEGILQGLWQLAEDANSLAPWHGRTLYGSGTGREWISAVDLCTEEKAEWALKLARRGFKATQKFMTKWFK